MCLPLHPEKLSPNVDKSANVDNCRQISEDRGKRTVSQAGKRNEVVLFNPQRQGKKSRKERTSQTVNQNPERMFRVKEKMFMFRDFDRRIDERLIRAFFTPQKLHFHCKSQKPLRRQVNNYKGRRQDPTRTGQQAHVVEDDFLGRQFLGGGGHMCKNDHKTSTHHSHTLIHTHLMMLGNQCWTFLQFFGNCTHIF